MDAAEFKESQGDGSVPRVQRYLRVFCLTTDEGSDEKKCRDYCNWVSWSVAWVWVFQLCCLLHQVHLISKAMLAGVDIFILFFFQMTLATGFENLEWYNLQI